MPQSAGCATCWLGAANVAIGANSLFVSREKFKPMHFRRAVQFIIERGKGYRSAEHGLQEIGCRQMERVKRPKGVFLRQIAGLANQRFINGQPMESFPVPLEFPSAFVKSGTGYVTRAAFSRQRGTRFRVRHQTGGDEIRIGNCLPYNFAARFLCVELHQR